MKYFLYFVSMEKPDLGLKPGLTSNKPVNYLLDYGDYNIKNNFNFKKKTKFNNIQIISVNQKMFVNLKILYIELNLISF